MPVAKKTIRDISWPTIINALSQLVVFNTYDFHEFLHQVIILTQQVIPVDSCLIYFLDQEKNQLILIGSKSSHPKILNNLSLSFGEGITGWVAKNRQTVAISQKAYQDPRFKLFKELPEDKYESFLSVPIIGETGVVGVINFQHKMKYHFSADETTTIEAIVKIISSGFTKVILQRKIANLTGKLEERKTIEKAKGVLMKVKNLSEDEAFRLLRNESMNKRKSIREIADAILLLWQ